MKYLIPLLFLASPVMAQEEVSPFEACLSEVRTSGGDAYEARKVGTPNSCCEYERDGEWNLCVDGKTWQQG